MSRSGKRFEFRLQSVLNVHEQRTEEARLALSQAVARAQDQSRKVERIRRRIADERLNPTSSSSVLRMRRAGSYLLVLQRDLVREERLLAAHQKAETAARDKLVTLRQQEETVRAMRTAAYEAHKVEQTRAENQEADEIAALVTARKRRTA